MNPTTLGYSILSAIQELTDELKLSRGEMQATREGIEKLREDLRMAHFDSTTCGNCGAGFEMKIAGLVTRRNVVWGFQRLGELHITYIVRMLYVWRTSRNDRNSGGFNCGSSQTGL